LDISLHYISSKKTLIGKLLLFLTGLFLFLFALDLMGASFELLSNNSFKTIINAASNPFIGLIIGLLVTALIQSSSTTTAMVVTAVASGSITLHNAIPIIMGANIGTTITSTIISLGYISKKEEFQRAISAGVLHDFFNIIIVFLLFPLEYKYNVLTNSAEYFSHLINSDISNTDSVVKLKLFDLSFIVQKTNEMLPNAVIGLLLSFFLLFISIKIISQIIYRFIIGKTESKLNKYVFNDDLRAFSWGALVTGLIQSSSITTSLIVPIVATGKTTLKKVMPFILGANIGTTVTAFIAVMYKSQAALNIAFAHLLFNIFGVIFFLSSPVLRHLLIWIATKFGNIAGRYKFTIFIYILLVFFIIPFLLILFN
jgi:sodium-dependent phosphate cotransporter